MQYTDKMKSIYIHSISSPSSSHDLEESRYEVADGSADGSGYRFVSFYLAISLVSLFGGTFSLSLVGQGLWVVAPIEREPE